MSGNSAEHKGTIRFHGISGDRPSPGEFGLRVEIDAYCPPFMLQMVAAHLIAVSSASDTTPIAQILLLVSQAVLDELEDPNNG